MPAYTDYDASATLPWRARCSGLVQAVLLGGPVSKTEICGSQLRSGLH